MAKKASKPAAKKKAAPKDPYAHIKKCKTLGELFDVRPEDESSEEYQVWVAKGAFLAKESGVRFTRM